MNQSQKSLIGRAVWVAATLAGCASAEDPLPPGPTPVPDSTPPSISVEFPLTATGYDETGDSLVDLRITWTDSGGAIDPATVALRGPWSGMPGDADLLTEWQVERLDERSFVAHETISGLLTGGPITLTVSVRDTAGNMATDSVGLVLPHGAYLKTLNTGIGAGPAQQVTVCEDDLRVYMTGGFNIVVADAEGLSLVGVYRDSSAADWLGVPLCVPGDSILYVTHRVERFDRRALRWLTTVDGTYGSYAIAQSRRDGNLLYVGESYVGGVAVVDRRLNRRVGSLPLPPASSYSAYVWDIWPATDDSVLYIARSGDGVLIYRLDAGAVSAVIDGLARRIQLNRDETVLWILRDAYLDEYATGSRAQLRLYHLPGFGQDFAVSPSERRAFISMQDWDADHPGDNVLLDVENWVVLTTFPRPHPPGTIRWDGGVAFHPNGKLVFVGRDRNIDIYLNRE